MIINFSADQPYWSTYLPRLYREYQVISGITGVTNNQKEINKRLLGFCNYLRDNNILNIRYIENSQPAIYEIKEDELLTMFLLKNDNRF